MAVGNTRRLALAVMIAATAATGARDARAHGGIPRAEDILFEPGNPSHIVVRSDYWGLFETRDAGRTWVLICSEAFAANSLLSNKLPTAVAAGGRILVSTGVAGLQVSDDGCDFRPVAGLLSGPQGDGISTGLSPIDTAGRNFLLVDEAGRDGGLTSRILRSADRGDTWSVVTSTLPSDFAASSVAFAPSDFRRLYAAGAVLDGAYAVEVSDDGGATWRSRPLPAVGNGRLVIAAVLPDQPDRLVVRIDGFDDIGNVEPDELWSTQDAGQHWTRILQARGDLPGFALAPDSGSLLIAGPNDGVQWALVKEIFTTRTGVLNADPFIGLLDGQAFGLAYSQGKLFVGTNQFAQGGEPRATLQVTTDQLQSFTPVMDLCSVTFPKCAPTSTVARQCSDPWDGFMLDYFQSAPCARDAGATATGAAGAGGTVSSGGGSEARGGEGGGAAPGGTAGSGDQDASVGAGGVPADRRLHIATVACSTSASRAPAFPASVLVMSVALGAAVRRLRGSARRSV